MSFEPETQRIPDSVKSIQLRLTVSEKADGTGNIYEGVYDFHVLDVEAKSLTNRTGDFVAHVLANAPSDIIQAQKSVLDWALTEAQRTIQP